MRLFYYYILSCILLGYSKEPYFDLFDFNEFVIEKIELGEIVTIKTDKKFGNAEHYQVYGIIDANIEEIFETIENFDNYAKFMPRFDYVETIKFRDGLTNYIFNIRLPMNIKYKYKIKTKKYIETSSAWLAWETVPWDGNSINETWGQWYLEPYGNLNNQTLIQYQVYTDPGYVPFGFQWAIDILTKKSLPETVRNLKIWVEDEN